MGKSETLHHLFKEYIYLRNYKVPWLFLITKYERRFVGVSNLWSSKRSIDSAHAKQFVLVTAYIVGNLHNCSTVNMILSIKSLNGTYISRALRDINKRPVVRILRKESNIFKFSLFLNIIFKGQWMVCINSNMATPTYFCYCWQIVSNCVSPRVYRLFILNFSVDYKLFYRYSSKKLIKIY